MSIFSSPDWKLAHNEAQKWANQLGRETGIEKAVEFGKTVYRVHFLPKPQNRYGFELRCELVPPTS